MPRRRLVLGARSTGAAPVLFVLLGAVLGPHGLNALGRGVLTQVHGVAWVALAIIGVFVGLGLAVRRSEPPANAFLSASVIALTTITTIAVGLYVLLTRSQIDLPGSIVAGSILVALCASVSAAFQTTSNASVELERASRLADLDDVPLLLFGAVILAGLTDGSPALRLVATVAAGAAIGLAGSLMFTRADESERGLFVAGAVLLLAGVGSYLGTSPLLSGCVAALVWVRVPGPADRITAHDLRILQHPLVALLLVIAGASIDWSTTVLWIAALIVVLRFAAKLLASVVAARFADISPALLASTLLQPGVMGIAFAVNVALVLGDRSNWILSTVTISTAVSEIFAAFLPRGDDEAAA
jgi:hypothetical protein